MNARMTSKRIYNPKECKPSLWQTCALIRYSPYSFFSPVLGLRVKSTPVPESPPMFPNTIACTLTAVPLRPVIWLIMRYFLALELSHESKTALTANRNCCTGSARQSSCPSHYFMNILMLLWNQVQSVLCSELKKITSWKVFTKGLLIDRLVFLNELLQILSCKICVKVHTSCSFHGLQFMLKKSMRDTHDLSHRKHRAYHKFISKWGIFLCTGSASHWTDMTN